MLGIPDFESLQDRYRLQCDAHQMIAQKNLALVQAGTCPSKDELKSERRAAAAVARLRDDLLAAISQLGQQHSSTAGIG